LSAAVCCSVASSDAVFSFHGVQEVQVFLSSAFCCVGWFGSGITGVTFFGIQYNVFQS
jgi:hypothetical protein